MKPSHLGVQLDPFLISFFDYDQILQGSQNARNWEWIGVFSQGSVGCGHVKRVEGAIVALFPSRQNPSVIGSRPVCLVVLQRVYQHLSGELEIDGGSSMLTGARSAGLDCFGGEDWICEEEMKRSTRNYHSPR